MMALEVRGMDYREEGKVNKRKLFMWYLLDATRLNDKSTG